MCSRTEFTKCGSLKSELTGQLILIRTFNCTPDMELCYSTMNRINRAIEIITEMESIGCEEYICKKEAYISLKTELSNASVSKLSNKVLEAFFTQTEPKASLISNLRKSHKGFIAE